MKAWRGDDLRVRRLGAHGGATWQSRKRRKHGRPSPTRAAATVRPPVRRSPRRARRSRRTSTSSLTRSTTRSEEHTSELQSQSNLVCRLLLEKKKKPPQMSLEYRSVPHDRILIAHLSESWVLRSSLAADRTLSEHTQYTQMRS